MDVVVVGGLVVSSIVAVSGSLAVVGSVVVQCGRVISSIVVVSGSVVVRCSVVVDGGLVTSLLVDVSGPAIWMFCRLTADGADRSVNSRRGDIFRSSIVWSSSRWMLCSW